jgi:HEAT repeat protein
VYQSDPSEAGPALARKSIPRATFARLFPAVLAHRRERAAIAARPARERVAYLISRLGAFGPPLNSEQASEALVKMGAPAVPPLVHALDDPDTGWQAAMILAQIGAPAALPAIPALTAHARVACSAQMWSAIALGQLGQIDALVALARRRTTQGVAVDGLKHARPASYPALDALLARGDKALTKVIAEALRPGSASFAKTPADFEALARAAGSPHAVLRTDVAGALGDSDLGERNRARAVPLLVGMLGDRSSEVRRLATLSLGWCRRHARAELPRLRAMKRDRAEAVRNAAATAIEEITGRRR